MIRVIQYDVMFIAEVDHFIYYVVIGLPSTKVFLGYIFAEQTSVCFAFFQNIP